MPALPEDTLLHHRAHGDEPAKVVWYVLEAILTLSHLATNARRWWRVRTR
jgi:hypothetical protein